MLKKMSVITIVALLLGTVVITPSLAQARQGSDDANREVESQQSVSPSTTPEAEQRKPESERAREVREKAKQRREELKAEVQQKKNEAKDSARIERCQKKQDRFQEKYGSLQERARKVEARIQARLTRAQAFAIEKNLSIPNSQALLSDIDSKRQAVLAATENIRAAAAGFDCANDDAKQQAELIRTEIQTFKAAVKEYRTSVKAYFTAVVQAYTATLPSESASPTPTVGSQGGNS